jgi:hypothetical protein
VSRQSTRKGVPSIDDYESLSHSKWECKYHVVFIPKYRRKTLYAELRRHLGEVFRKLAEQKESRIGKRQGTKSRREVVEWRSRRGLVRQERYGDLGTRAAVPS